MAFVAAWQHNIELRGNLEERQIKHEDKYQKASK
jgi:hypothetical protein